MIAKGILYIVLIVLGGAFMLISLIITLVKYSGNGKGAGQWLIGFFAGLLILVSSVFLLTRGVINKTKEFTENFTTMGFEQMRVLDSLNRIDQLNEDSLLQSKQVSVIISIEPLVFKGKVPSQFYTYLGFRDYYRMPLRYPYSIHCIDSLGFGELYNEESVMQFDVNDNGELFCDIDHIKTFCFNREFLIGSRIRTQTGRPVTAYFAYDFNNKEAKEFRNEAELRKFAVANGFEKEVEFYTVKTYYESF